MPAYLVKSFKDITPDKAFKGRFFLLKYYSNSTDEVLICLIVSKKHLNKASHRNLVKRRVRSILNSVKDLKPGNYIFIALGGVSKNVTYEDISFDINSLLSKIY